jgi:hypothetical protein
MTIPPEVLEQIMSAYRDMAEHYRPAAPNDGFGHITVPMDALDLEAEAAAYADSWWREESALSFWTGCCAFQNRRAMVWTIEAARLMCAGPTRFGKLAETLLAMALREMKAVNRAQKGRA